MTKDRMELSKKIQRCANRGVRKARAAAKRAGIPVVDSINGKLVKVYL